MKVHREEFSFKTGEEFEFRDMTSEIDEIIHRSGINEGIALVFAGHATGVIVITEYESGLLRDIKNLLGKMIPTRGPYNHSGNAHAHLRSLFLAPSKVVPIHNGRAALGTWQSIFWIETETYPRNRKVQVYAVGE